MMMFGGVNINPQINNCMAAWTFWWHTGSSARSPAAEDR